jgi:hypothetical protein
MSADGAPVAPSRIESAARALGLATAAGGLAGGLPASAPDLDRIDRTAAASSFEARRHGRRGSAAHGVRAPSLHRGPAGRRRYARRPERGSCGATSAFPSSSETAEAGAHKTSRAACSRPPATSTALRVVAQDRLAGWRPVLVTEGTEALAGACRTQSLAAGRSGRAAFAELMADATRARASHRRRAAELSRVARPDGFAGAGGGPQRPIGWRWSTCALARPAIEHHPGVAELDLNPVLAGPGGCVAVVPASGCVVERGARGRPGEQGRRGIASVERRRPSAAFAPMARRWRDTLSATTEKSPRCLSAWQSADLTCGCVPVGVRGAAQPSVGQHQRSRRHTDAYHLLRHDTVQAVPAESRSRTRCPDGVADPSLLRGR